jgi:hypothetical protein
MSAASCPYVNLCMTISLCEQARSCLYAKNQLLAHHFGKKKKLLLALKNIITDMGRISLFQYN